MKLHHFAFIFCFFTALIFISSCATVVKPNGGDKDTTPPQILEAIPSDSSMNFNSNKITINFDEYVKISTKNKRIILNPFSNKEIETTIKGKKILITLPDSLKPNTTYCLTLENAIQDITENNAIKKYNYIFSTGETLDSCSITGSVVDAFDNKICKDAWVMLHKQLSDVKDTNPIYLAHTNDAGQFKFSNLQSGKYYILALTDANSDYRYNLTKEKIAFENEPIELSGNSTYKDSIELRIFEQADSIQKKLKGEVIAFRTAKISFRNSFVNPKIEMLKCPNAIHEWNQTKDTIIFWDFERKQDSIKFVISENSYKDTITQSFKVISRNKKIATDTTFKISSNLVQGKLLHFDTLYLKSAAPINSFDSTKLKLTSDSSDVAFTITKQSDNSHIIKILFEKKQKQNFNLTILKGAITNCFGFANDSTSLKFAVSEETDFGTLLIKFKNEIKSPYILQLSSKQKSYEIYNVIPCDSIKIEKILPGDYSIKLIIDEDENKKFTNGNFDKRRLPEMVFTLPKAITIVKNWDNKITWDF